MQRCPNSHPSDAAVVHVRRSVRAKEVALEDAGGELDAVLDRGVERVHHRWPAVPLPVRLVHLEVVGVRILIVILSALFVTFSRSFFQA